MSAKCAASLEGAVMPHEGATRLYLQGREEPDRAHYCNAVSDRQRPRCRVEQTLSHTGIRQLEVAAMSQDPFMQEIALLSRELSAEQRAVVLEAVSDAAIHANSGVEP